MTIALERSYRFSASHRYSRPEWSEEENLARFGRCAWAPGHGHSYRLTIWVDGAVDPLTGFVIDLSELDRLVTARVLDRLDHRHLNDAVAEFLPGAAIPSSENLASWIAEQLRGAMPSGARLTRLRIAEEDDLASVWTAD